MVLKDWLGSFGTVIVGLHILALWSFAVAQPLFDLVARYPTFLIAHGLTGGNLWVFIVCLSLLIPIGLALFVLLLQRLQPTLAAVVAAGVVVLLLFVTFLPLPFSFWPELRARSGLAMAGVLSAGLLIAYGRSGRFREVFSWLAIAIVAFPLLFLLQPAVAGLLVKTDATREDVAATLHADRTPTDLPDLMMLVFDELPLTALMNNTGAVDRDLFPNFARLADVADFYSATTTVAPRTSTAVPALLTGRLPTAGAPPPDANSHPQNLFSLLQSHYELDVFESITQLCEGVNCTHAALVWQQVALDSAVVLAHRISPPSLRPLLPTIGQNWGGFVTASTPSVDSYTESARLREFVARVGSGEGRRFSFIHSVLPHAAYIVLPDGQRLFRHRPTSGYVLEGNIDGLADTDYAETESLQFFRWQLGFVDNQIGELLDRLQESGRYDQTLLVVTADHGVSLRRNQPRREPVAGNLLEIISVPLFYQACRARDRENLHPSYADDRCRANDTRRAWFFCPAIT